MSRRGFSSVFPYALIAAVCLLAAPAAFGTTCESIASGNYHDPGNWDCGSVPGNGSQATITAGHALTATQNIYTSHVLIASGGLLEIEGYSVFMEVLNLIVEDGAILRGSSAVPSNVYVRGPFNVGLNVINDGRIVGGPGGGVFIHDQSPGGDLPCPLGSSIQSNGGSFEGGAGRGNVYLLAQHVELHGAQVLGGSGNVPASQYGGGIAGSVYIAGLTVNVMDQSYVKSGDNTSTAPGAIGGSVKISAQSCNPTSDGDLVIDETSVVEVGQPSSNNCPGALIYAASSSVILGKVAPGAAGCIYWDPPDLYLAADAELTGREIIVAGETLDASGLALRTLPTPALDAGDVLEINLRPGGTLDLQGLAPGFAYFRAGGSITIRADNVVTDNGVDLEDLMTPAPDWLPGAETLRLALTPDSQRFVSPGTSVSHPLQITNVGTAAVDVEVWIEDSQGWLQGGAQQIQTRLEPGEPILRNLTIDVPWVAGRSRSTEVKASARIVGGKTPWISRAVFIMND